MLYFRSRPSGAMAADKRLAASGARLFARTYSCLPRAGQCSLLPRLGRQLDLAQKQSVGAVDHRSLWLALSLADGQFPTRFRMSPPTTASRAFSTVLLAAQRVVGRSTSWYLLNIPVTCDTSGISLSGELSLTDGVATLESGAQDGLVGDIGCGYIGAAVADARCRTLGQPWAEHRDRDARPAVPRLARNPRSRVRVTLNAGSLRELRACALRP
jgi:hypothetical protein